MFTGQPLTLIFQRILRYLLSTHQLSSLFTIHRGILNVHTVLCTTNFIFLERNVKLWGFHWRKAALTWKRADSLIIEQMEQGISMDFHWCGYVLQCTVAKGTVSEDGLPLWEVDCCLTMVNSFSRLLKSWGRKDSRHNKGTWPLQWEAGKANSAFNLGRVLCGHSSHCCALMTHDDYSYLGELVRVHIGP